MHAGLGGVGGQMRGGRKRVWEAGFDLRFAHDDRGYLTRIRATQQGRIGRSAQIQRLSSPGADSGRQTETSTGTLRRRLHCI